MTAFSTTQTAIEAMKMGAYDYFQKPFKMDEAQLVIDRALDRRRLVVESRRMRDALDAHSKSTSPTLDAIVSTLGEVSTGARAQWGGEQSRLGGAAPGANLARGRGGRSRRSGGEGAADLAGDATPQG
jgi:hypothetical protein